MPRRQIGVEAEKKMSWALDRVIVDANSCGRVDWSALSRSGDIMVEIGFGNGEFLEFLGGAHPDALIIGAEVSQWCAAKAARRVAASGLDNVRILHGDARFLLPRCFEAASVSRIYMNYPCPWPKTRHAERRVTVPIFSALLNRLLTVGGVFELATDVDWYAEECAAALSSSGAFDVERVIKNPQRPYATKYGRKWKAMGKDTWLLAARKNGAVKVDESVEEDFSMELETGGKKTLEQLIGELEDMSGKGTDGTGRWVFREGFISGGNVALLLTITADEGFEQHFYLKIIAKERGFTIKVDSVGHPYRTPAMRAALQYALKAAERV